jgi:hypothetical protein
LSPTDGPTNPPSLSPTDGPTNPPSLSPTDGPTNPPSLSPTDGPTNPPSLSPTDGPTNPPSLSPTDGPTNPPSLSPTDGPTNPPSLSPTDGPTNPPSLSPTDAPTTNSFLVEVSSSSHELTLEEEVTGYSLSGGKAVIMPSGVVIAERLSGGGARNIMSAGLSLSGIASGILPVAAAWYISNQLGNMVDQGVTMESIMPRFLMASEENLTSEVTQAIESIAALSPNGNLIEGLNSFYKFIDEHQITDLNQVDITVEPYIEYAKAIKSLEILDLSGNGDRNNGLIQFTDKISNIISSDISKDVETEKAKYEEKSQQNDDDSSNKGSRPRSNKANAVELLSSLVLFNWFTTHNRKKRRGTEKGIVDLLENLMLERVEEMSEYYDIADDITLLVDVLNSHTGRNLDAFVSPVTGGVLSGYEKQYVQGFIDKLDEEVTQKSIIAYVTSEFSNGESKLDPEVVGKIYDLIASKGEIDSNLKGLDKNIEEGITLLVDFLNSRKDLDAFVSPFTGNLISGEEKEYVQGFINKLDEEVNQKSITEYVITEVKNRKSVLPNPEIVGQIYDAIVTARKIESELRLADYVVNERAKNGTFPEGYAIEEGSPERIIEERIVKYKKDNETTATDENLTLLQKRKLVVDVVSSLLDESTQLQPNQESALASGLANTLSLDQISVLESESEQGDNSKKNPLFSRERVDGIYSDLFPQEKSFIEARLEAAKTTAVAPYNFAKTLYKHASGESKNNKDKIGGPNFAVNFEEVANQTMSTRERLGGLGYGLLGTSSGFNSEEYERNIKEGKIGRLNYDIMGIALQHMSKGKENSLNRRLSDESVSSESQGNPLRIVEMPNNTRSTATWIKDSIMGTEKDREDKERLQKLLGKKRYNAVTEKREFTKSETDEIWKDMNAPQPVYNAHGFVQDDLDIQLGGWESPKSAENQEFLSDSEASFKEKFTSVATNLFPESPPKTPFKDNNITAYTPGSQDLESAFLLRKVKPNNVVKVRSRSFDSKDDTPGSSAPDPDFLPGRVKQKVISLKDGNESDGSRS